MADVWNTIQNMREVVKCLDDDTRVNVFVDYDWTESENVGAKIIRRIKRTPLLLNALLDELIRAMPPEEIPFTDPPEDEASYSQSGLFVIDA